MYQVCWKYVFICSFSANSIKRQQQISNIKMCMLVDNDKTLLGGALFIGTPGRQSITAVSHLFYVQT